MTDLQARWVGSEVSAPEWVHVVRDVVTHPDGTSEVQYVAADFNPGDGLTITEDGTKHDEEYWGEWRVMRQFADDDGEACVVLRRSRTGLLPPLPVW